MIAETATRLARAVESRDAVAAGHVERMSRHCGLLANRAGLDPGRCEQIEIASRLHDVGKLGVPDAVLLKAGKLDATDREHAARDRASAGTDELTGALRRGVGLAALVREIDRASRAQDTLVVAFVDVDGLKAVNDTDGHATGDALLVRVAQTLKASMRPSDLVMRFGGDEFVCVLPGIGTDLANERLRQVSINLAMGFAAGSVSFGLAELEPGDTADALVSRADAKLIAARQAPRPDAWPRAS